MILDLKVSAMKLLPPDAMREATSLTRGGRLGEATALIRRLLGGLAGKDSAPESPKPYIDGESTPEAEAAPGPSARRRLPPVINVAPDAASATPPRPNSPPLPEAAPAARSRPNSPPFMEATPAATAGAAAARLGEFPWIDAQSSASAEAARLLRWPPFARTKSAPPAAEPVTGGQFLARTYAGAAGRLTYKLYVSRNRSAAPAPLIVMLHGCTQSPDDFAAGTRMNELAEEHGWLVVYPAQEKTANAQKCWNWFSPADQGREMGEPALIAGITRQVMAEHSVDARRVYAAGLSAGGAAADIMGHAYPEIFAAVGVHSGLACGAARDVPSAFAAMRRGAATLPKPPNGRQIMPTIVFHADKDTTVHPRNGDQVITQSAPIGQLRTVVRQGQVPGGHAYSHTVHADASGKPMLEQWLVHGGGHAWSGGSPAGTYTDPRGPDASREMLRFFSEHARAD
jgi:poly(hydroxyalkanoate) depolymerase family esterase